LAIYLGCIGPVGCEVRLSPGRTVSVGGRL